MKKIVKIKIGIKEGRIKYNKDYFSSKKDCLERVKVWIDKAIELEENEG